MLKQYIHKSTHQPRAISQGWCSWGYIGLILTSYCGGENQFILDYITVLIRREVVIFRSPEDFLEKVESRVGLR